MEDKLTQEPSIASAENSNVPRRRKLLPLWIRIFVWFFMVTGSVSPLVFIAGLIGIRAKLSLLGLETNNPVSAIGIFLIITFMFFGFIALSLWTEKIWAIKLAKVGALFGMAICTFSMLIYPYFITKKGGITIRFELAVLIPYLFKLQKIQAEWEKSTPIQES